VFLWRAFKGIYVLRATLMGRQCSCVNSDQSTYKKLHLVLRVETLCICSPVKVKIRSF